MFTNGWPPQKNAADSFTRVLGSSPRRAIIKRTVTTQELRVAEWARLRIATNHVELTLEYEAIVTGLLIAPQSSRSEP